MYDSWLCPVYERTGWGLIEPVFPVSWSVRARECAVIIGREQLWSGRSAKQLLLQCWLIWCVSPGEVLPAKLCEGVRPASENAHHVYEQNMSFSLPFYDLTLSLIPSFRPSLYSVPGSVLDLIDNDGKVASSQDLIAKPYPIYAQNGQNRYPIYDQNDKNLSKAVRVTATEACLFLVLDVHWYWKKETVRL